MSRYDPIAYSVFHNPCAIIFTDLKYNIFGITEPAASDSVESNISGSIWTPVSVAVTKAVYRPTESFAKNVIESYET